MRFDEIAEALPGQVGTIGRALAKVGMGGKAAAAEKAMRNQAKQAYKLWLTVVPKLQAGGTNMNDIRIYSRYFGNWMAANLKTNISDPIITSLMNDVRSKGNNLQSADLIKLITQAMGKKRAETLRKNSAVPPPTPPTGGPPPTPPTGGPPPTPPAP